jgi:MEMO1 family protein
MPVEYLQLCCVTPHPPILVPEVGGREALKVEETSRALGSLAAEIESIDPETIVIMSPHTPIFADAFTVKMAPLLEGSFRSFGAASVIIRAEPDLELSEGIIKCAGKAGIRVKKSADGPMSKGSELDHGILVPLYFLEKKTYPLVCLSLSLLEYGDHYRLGTCVREAAASLQKKIVFVASGDMSHYLSDSGPYGYNPNGERFDRQIVEIMNSGDYRRLFEMDPFMIEQAGECGLRSIFALAGAVDGYSVDSSVLSYEGTFGVGYMVARVVPGEPDPRRSLGAATGR